MHRRIRESDNTKEVRRRYVLPQPKEQASSQREKRARANTQGVAVGSQDVDDTLANGMDNLRCDEGVEDGRETPTEHDMDARSAQSQNEGEDGFEPPERGGEIRPLAAVIEDVADDMSKECHERTRLRMADHTDRLETVECVLRGQARLLALHSARLGAHMSVFPPKGMSAAEVRNRLTLAWWDGRFERAVVSFSNEYEVPCTMMLAMSSSGKFVEEVCQTLIPGCWPTLENATSVQAQDNQCKELRQELNRCNKNYNIHSGYTTGEYTLVYGFPLQRRPLEHGGLDDSDDWSVEVVLHDASNREYKAVLLTCCYDHDMQVQKFTIDQRGLDSMQWSRDDVSGPLNRISEMYLPRIQWIGAPDDAQLTPKGKARLRALKGDGKARNAAFDVTPKPAGVGMLSGAGIPGSFFSGKDGGKQNQQQPYGKQSGGKPTSGKQNGQNYKGAGKPCAGSGMGKQSYTGGGKPNYLYGSSGKAGPVGGGKTMQATFGDGGSSHPFPPPPPPVGFAGQFQNQPPIDPWQMMQNLLASKGSWTPQQHF